MVLVEYSAGLPWSADQVWKVLRDFGGIAAWHPAIVKSGIESEVGILRVGAVRRLALADGGVLRERLIEFDDGLRALAYVFEESPLPVDGYRAQVRVDEVAGLVERCGSGSAVVPATAAACWSRRR